MPVIPFAKHNLTGLSGINRFANKGSSGLNRFARKKKGGVTEVISIRIIVLYFILIIELFQCKEQLTIVSKHVSEVLNALLSKTSTVPSSKVCCCRIRKL